MISQKRTKLYRLLIWRYRHISNKNFVLILSILVGFLAGLVSLLLKNITHLIQLVLESDIISWQTSLYFVTPVIGLLIVYVFTKFIFKKNIQSAIPLILYSLSKRNGIIDGIQAYIGSHKYSGD